MTNMDYLIFLCLLLTNMILYSMEAENETLTKMMVYAVPGYNGLGSNPKYVQEVVGDNVEVVPVRTPVIFSSEACWRCRLTD